MQTSSQGAVVTDKLVIKLANSRKHCSCFQFLDQATPSQLQLFRSIWMLLDDSMKPRKEIHISLTLQKADSEERL